MDNEQPTLTARVARLEAVILDRGEPEYAGNTSQTKTAGLMHADQAKPKNPTALEEIFERIQTCSERVIRTAHNLEDIGMRIMGPLPEGDSGGATEAYVDGTLDQALRALNRLDGSLARLEAAALRLERV